MSSAGRTLFQLGYEISPIIFTHGIAENMPGSMLPIVLFTQAASFIQGVLGGSDNLLNPDSFFAHFQPLAGSTLADFDYGRYPFANQNVAANAIIGQPLKVSMVMVCPAQGTFGYGSKLATLIALAATIKRHANRGGTYTVVTPAYIYTNCLLRSVTDISSGETGQPQITWRWDFEQPLLSLASAANAQSLLLKKITAGLPTAGSLSGGASQVGNLLNSDVSSVIPSSAPTPGAGVSGILESLPSQ